ncbi:hypothetical protein E2C01_086057 [Portunus trituberculatus]|uniref:Uncharacterized protein n=1 Tax=Portunus trituberculatus TaxID=210409 RepID=A0A5B7JFB3_PORTR|nr:hypothetical protein [Portunus trituberculatus]
MKGGAGLQTKVVCCGREGGQRQNSTSPSTTPRPQHDLALKGLIHWAVIF